MMGMKIVAIATASVDAVTNMPTIAIVVFTVLTKLLKTLTSFSPEASLGYLTSKEYEKKRNEQQK